MVGLPMAVKSVIWVFPKVIGACSGTGCLLATVGSPAIFAEVLGKAVAGFAGHSSDYRTGELEAESETANWLFLKFFGLIR